MLELSETIQSKIRELIIVPGEIVISLLREIKFTQKMNTFPQSISPKVKNKNKEIWKRSKKQEYEPSPSHLKEVGISKKN